MRDLDDVARARLGFIRVVPATTTMWRLLTRLDADLLARVLTRAKQAAAGRDVRLGGGVATIREFIEADPVDTMHIAVAPVDFGRGERLWESHTDLLDRFHLDSVPSPSGVTHLLFWRR